jgi:proliferating cell nuclear antigen
MNDARLFRNLIGAISSLIEEADFNATPEGIKLRSMDPSHIAMVDFEWPKAAFDTYECNTPTKLRLSVSNLLKLLKRTRSDESVEIVYDDANKKLNITLKDKIVRKFITPTLDPSTEEVPTPKVPFNARVKITAVSLRDIIDDAQSISDNVKLEVSPEKFIVRATGELSSAIIEMDKGSDASRYTRILHQHAHQGRVRNAPARQALLLSRPQNRTRIRPHANKGRSSKIPLSL